MLQPFRSSDEENNDSRIKEPLLFGWITNQPIESEEVKEMSLKSDEPNSKNNSCEREDIKTEKKRGNTWIQYQEDYCKNEQLSNWRVVIDWTRNWSGSYLDMEQTYYSIWKSQSEELRRILFCSKWKDRCRGEPRDGSLLYPNSLRTPF